jgi:hypothetical protein
MLKETIFFIVFSIYAYSCSAKCLTNSLTIGGRQNADINDANVISAAQFAINQLYGSRDYVIISAQTQIVAGENYFLTVKFPDTGEKCEITVYDRFGDKSITSNTCSAIEISGGISDVDVNDPGVIAASNYIVDNVSFGLSTKNYILDSAKQQVVAGVKYYLKYIFPDNPPYGGSCEVEVIHQSWMEQIYTVESISCVL